ncbi:hypothetical protein [[Eubacterium] cellulosolvens]
MNKHEHMPDPEKIKEILNVVSDRVPELLRNLSDVLYGADQAKKFGKAAAVFYKELKGTGMTDEQIFELTRQYMSTLSIGNAFGKFAKDHEYDYEHEHEFGEEVGKRVGRKIRKAIKE